MVETNILLVDDDEDYCASMSDVLSDLGYRLDRANDGIGALELAGGHQYRLAMLDYNMPGMNGLQLCRRLKACQANIVVALLTAFSPATLSGEAAEAGVRLCLLKPVNFAVLVPFVAESVGVGVG